MKRRLLLGTLCALLLAACDDAPLPEKRPLPEKDPVPKTGNHLPGRVQAGTESLENAHEAGAVLEQRAAEGEQAIRDQTQK